MASRLVFLQLSVLFALILVNTKPTNSTDVNENEQLFESHDTSDSSLKLELNQLKSHIHTLESSAADKAFQLNSKDILLSEKEEIISKHADRIALLQSEIGSLRKKDASDAHEQVGKAIARASELEQVVDTLKKELKMKDNEKDTLESQRQESEKNLVELHTKIANLEKIVKEQETRIHKTERALQAAEEELMKAKFVATSKVHELTEVHGAWLPPWLASHLIHYQSLLETNWNMHGKPAMQKVIQKALEKKSEAEKWAEPHVETIKIKYVPAVKEQWVMITKAVAPHIQSLKDKSAKTYDSSKTTLTPHVIKVQQFVVPCIQEVKKVSKPYIDRVAISVKPHVDQLRVALTPYTEPVVHAYRKFLESATIYHQQVQVTVQEKLEQYELTKAFVTKEFAWFAASALLALPIIVLFRLCSAILCKDKKSIRNGNSHHARRKAKRSHSDK